MKVNGTATMQAPIEEVWAALVDPGVLARAIPGCQELLPVRANTYLVRIVADVAGADRTYRGEVTLADQQPYTAFVVQATSRRAEAAPDGPDTTDATDPNGLSASVTVILDDLGDETTLVSYTAEAVLGGAGGDLSQRVLSGVARKLAQEFFRRVNQVLDTEAANPFRTTVSVQSGPEAEGDSPSNAVTISVTPTVAPAPTPDSGGGNVAGRIGARLVARARHDHDEGFRRAPASAPPQLPAVLAGALIAFLGVALGWRIGRR